MATQGWDFSHFHNLLLIPPDKTQSSHSQPGLKSSPCNPPLTSRPSATLSYLGPSYQTYRPPSQSFITTTLSQPASQQLLSNALGALPLRNQPDRQYPLLLSSNKVPKVAINLKQDDSQLRGSLALVICSIRSTLPSPPVRRRFGMSTIQSVWLSGWSTRHLVVWCLHACILRVLYYCSCGLSTE